MYFFTDQTRRMYWLRPHCLLLLTLFLCFAPTRSLAECAYTATEYRPYAGKIRRDMAEYAASLAAEREAYNAAATALTEKDALKHLPAPLDNNAPPLSQGLARRVFSARLEKSGHTIMDGSPMAEATVCLLPPRKKRAAPNPEGDPAVDPVIDPAVDAALERMDLLEINAQFADYQGQLLRQYDATAASIMLRDARKSGGMEDMHRLEHIVRLLRSTQNVLPIWNAVGRNLPVPLNMENKLKAADTHAQGNPLVQCALAEIALQQHAPMQALEYAAKAVTAAPGFARAHEVKGTALLRMRLIKEALENYNLAVRLSPGNPVYYVHRSQASLQLGDEDALCRDLHKACALGECGPLARTLQSGQCAAGISGAITISNTTATGKTPARQKEKP